MNVFKDLGYLNTCLLSPEVQEFEPIAEDILTDEDLLDLFRIIKQVLRKTPTPEKLARLFYCLCYALSDHVKFIKPAHEDRIIFCDEVSDIYCVRLPASVSCCQDESSLQRWLDSSSSVASAASPGYNMLLQATYRPSFRPAYTTLPHSFGTPFSSHSTLSATDFVACGQQTDIIVEPQQRGFYYQGDRINREPALLQRYAEQGILTQASLLRKRKRHSTDSIQENTPIKKPKIPHRHGDFESRRDDIINRLRMISFKDLEQKASRMPQPFTFAIEQTYIAPVDPFTTDEQRKKLLQPALRILTDHSNKKPHLDNGMNQNGIYYNIDYFQLYLAFEQFQRIFAILFPKEVIPISKDNKDHDRNANMKAYRPWIEPLLTDSNWAAFRRNIVVGERMMQLAKSVGQGVLLITKELSGSKLHLTFTNSEWDEFINGLNSGRWDATIDWSKVPNVDQLQRQQQQDCCSSLLVTELREKFATPYWFEPDGTLVSTNNRKHVTVATQQQRVNLSSF